jgi:hypothetical protein
MLQFSGCGPMVGRPLWKRDIVQVRVLLPRLLLCPCGADGPAQQPLTLQTPGSNPVGDTIFSWNLGIVVVHRTVNPTYGGSIPPGSAISFAAERELVERPGSQLGEMGFEPPRQHLSFPGPEALIVMHSTVNRTKAGQYRPGPLFHRPDAPGWGNCLIRSGSMRPRWVRLPPGLLFL